MFGLFKNLFKSKAKDKIKPSDSVKFLVKEESEHFAFVYVYNYKDAKAVRDGFSLSEKLYNMGYIELKDLGGAYTPNKQYANLLWCMKAPGISERITGF